MLQSALLQALKLHKTDFVQLLLDQDFGGELEFDEFLTLKRLHILHEENVGSQNVSSTKNTKPCLLRKDTSTIFLYLYIFGGYR